MEAPRTPDPHAYPTCKICDRGTLLPRKIRRLSGPAVAIGYILLIPSILGTAACAILLIVSLFAAVTSAAHGSAFATAFAGAWSIAVVSGGISCFVFGLVGWLLIMKKQVLQCVYCGAAVDAAAAVYSSPPQRVASTRSLVLSFLIALGILGAVVGFIEAGTQASTPAATDEGPAQPTPENPTAAPAQLTSDNSTAEPAQPDTMQPFTSGNGRFTALFPGTLHFGSEPTHWKNGGPGTLYRVFAVTHDGKPNQTGYVVMYTDFTGDAAAEDAQTHLQNIETDFFANKTRLSERAVDLNGVPGRAYTAADSQHNYTMRDFVTGTRVYWVIVVTSKGYTAPQANRFLNSFRILDNPPRP